MRTEFDHGTSRMLARSRLAVFASFFALSSCGVTYNSPKVSEEGSEYDVSVVAMSPAAVSSANNSVYTPRSLPSAFSQTAGDTSSFKKKFSARSLPPKVPQTAYKIGVGDIILLATRSTGQTVEQLTGLLAAQSQRNGYTVRDDGAIAIPEVGAVAIEGLTIEEAEERVFQRLVQNQLDPEFSLEIAEFNSKKVSISGDVMQPQLLPITLNALHLEEAITEAGGMTLAMKKLGTIVINRHGNTYEIPLQAYFEDVSIRKTILTAGDSVFVNGKSENEIDLRRGDLEERRKNFERKLELGAVQQDHVYLAGEVREKNRIALPFETRASLADVFYENGGFPTTTGNPSHIYVLRKHNSEKLTAYHLDAKNVVNMAMATKFEMRPDDIVFVREQPITVWHRALQQVFPTLLNAGAVRLNN